MGGTGPDQVIVYKCRQRPLPIFYTAGVTEHAVEHAGRWYDKHPRTLKRPEDAHGIVDAIRPRPEDILIRKTKPSAFFGAPLIAVRIDLKVDTLVIAGCTTLGCVRA